MKTRMITRTVITSEVETLTVDIETSVVETKVFTLSGKIDDEKTALKQVKKEYETDNMKIVSVKGITTAETLYGMPEDVFIKNAEILPPRKDYSDKENGED